MKVLNIFLASIIILGCGQSRENQEISEPTLDSRNEFLYHANLDSINELSISKVPNNSVFIRVWKYHSYWYNNSEEIISLLYHNGQYTLSKKFYYDTREVPPAKDSLIFTRTYTIKHNMPVLNSIISDFTHSKIESENRHCLDGMGGEVELYIKTNGLEIYKTAMNNLPCMKDKTLYNLTQQLTYQIDSISGVNNDTLLFSKEYYEKEGWLNRPKTAR